MTFSDRISLAMRHAGVTNQGEFAALVRQQNGGEKFSQQTLSNLIVGKSTSSKYTVQIALAANVCPVWLAIGVGDMSVSISQDAIYLAKKIMKVNPDIRQKITHYLEIIELFETAEFDAQAILDDSFHMRNEKQNL